MTHSQHFNFYICSCVPDGGIYLCEMDESGKVEIKEFTPLDRPMYAVKDDDKLYVLLRAPFENSAESGLVSFDIGAEGELLNPSEIVSTKGEVACHLCVDGESVYAVNYISGSVSKCGEKTVCHSGVGPNLPRQDGPHTHYVSLTPDGEYLLATDLGLDSVFTYDKELNLQNVSKVPEGHGVRHLAFSDDGKICFAVNELASTVSAFEYCDGKLSLIDTASCIPESFDGETTAAAIRYNNGEVFVSNRGHDSVAVLEFKEGKLSLKNIFSCGGNGPRDFDLIGDYTVSTNEKSDSVTVIKNEKVVSELCIKSPICVTKI